MSAPSWLRSSAPHKLPPAGEGTDLGGCLREHVVKREAPVPSQGDAAHALVRRHAGGDIVNQLASDEWAHSACRRTQLHNGWLSWVSGVVGFLPKGFMVDQGAFGELGASLVCPRLLLLCLSQRGSGVAHTLESPTHHAPSRSSPGRAPNTNFPPAATGCHAQCPCWFPVNPGTEPYPPPTPRDRA